VEGCGTTASPFVDFKRSTHSGEWGGVHRHHPILFLACGAGGFGGGLGGPPTPPNVRKVFKIMDMSLYFPCVSWV
jgi:hypothetical protein